MQNAGAGSRAGYKQGRGQSDMGGSAAVIGTMVAIAKNELPLHVVGLVPATDNRPGGNAIVPGDVITISDGTTVERVCQGIITVSPESTK